MGFSVFKFETLTPTVSLRYDFCFPLCLVFKVGILFFFLLELMYVTYAVVVVGVVV